MDDLEGCIIETVTIISLAIMFIFATILSLQMFLIMTGIIE